VDHFLDVIVIPPAALVTSVKQGTTFGLISATLATPPVLLTPQIVDVEDDDDDFEVVADDFVSGPGNHPLDLATDGVTSTYVSGDDDVKVFSITLQPQNPITGTGTDTIAVHASLGTLAVGAGNAVRVYAVVAGAPRLVATVTFAGTVTIRGVALHTTDKGSFVLAAGGTSGLRIVQWSQSGTGSSSTVGGP
jgi:hypothetical protein